MRNLLHIFNFKATAILFSLMLTSCGSGGGGLDLGGGGGSGCDDTPVVRNGLNPLQSGESVQSTDKRASITNHDVQPINVTISVDCISFPSSSSGTQIGRGYNVSFGGSGQILPVLTVSYKDLLPAGVLETSLKLGDYDPLADNWEAEEAAVQDINEDTFTLSLTDPNDVRYTVYRSTTGGGTGSPPTTPTHVQAVAANGACIITISWDSSTDPDNDLSSYTVTRSGITIGSVTAGGSAPECPPGTRCAFQDDTTRNPQPIQGTQYFYTVRARDSQGNTSNEGTSNGVTAPSQCPQQ